MAISVYMNERLFNLISYNQPVLFIFVQTFLMLDTTILVKTIYNQYLTVQNNLKSAEKRWNWSLKSSGKLCWKFLSIYEVTLDKKLSSS